MQREIMLELFRYNAHTNHTLLERAAHLTEEQRTATTGFSFDSIYGTLVHIYSAEQLWRKRIQEGISLPRLHTPDDFPTFTDLQAAWQQEEQAMQAYLATLSDADLSGTITYTNLRGVETSLPLWKCLHHVVLHGMQHRSEVAAMLTVLGASPGNIDLIYFSPEA